MLFAPLGASQVHVARQHCMDLFFTTVVAYPWNARSFRLDHRFDMGQLRQTAPLLRFYTNFIEYTALCNHCCVTIYYRRNRKLTIYL